MGMPLALDKGRTGARRSRLWTQGYPKRDSGKGFKIRVLVFCFFFF